MQKKFVALVVPALLVAGIFLSTDAFATRVSISGTVSRSQLKKDCDSVGGACGNCNGTKGGYSCVNIGPGGTGQTVTCTAGGKCTGVYRQGPHQGVPTHTIGGILHAPSAGIKSSGNNAPPQGHRPPVKMTGFSPSSGIKTMGGGNQPAPIERAESHHFGGHR